MMLDTEATGGERWTLREDVQRRNLIVLGDINTNRAMLALYAKFLAAATGRFPGPGCYVLRHLAEPFTPEHTALVIGASDRLGLERGIARLLDLLRSRRALGFPLLEFGDADGPVEISEAGNTFRDYRDAAYVFYSGGRATARYAWFKPRSPRVAMQTARELVLKEAKKAAPYFPVGGHYTFIPNYQALRIIIAHGLLSAEELRLVEEKLLDNALINKDSYVRYFRDRRKRFMASSAGNPSRHSSSTIVGQYLLLDYLATFAKLSDAVRKPIQADYALFSKLVRDWADSRIFRARVGDLESLDCTAFFIYGFMHLGLEDFVDNGVLANMANFYLNNVNNLWCDAGASHYIGAYRGCHIRSPRGGLAVRALAFFTGDGGLEFLDTQRFEQAGTYQRGFADQSGMCLGQPEPFALPATKQEAAVLPCPMLRKTPPDPVMWRSAVSAAQESGTPLSLAYEQAYDTIGFRDGWSADDAFLAIKGVHQGRLWQVNSIVGCTDRGARFLFGGSQTRENWYRSSVTVDAAEYGSQDSFARLEAYVSTHDAALIASTCARFNGTRWQRTIFRQRGAFFAVLDDLTAIEGGDFRITATWRTLPPGRIDERGVFRATGQNGAHFAILPGASVAAKVTRPAVDGVARPTFYRQQRDARLAAGETVSFRNTICASPADRLPELTTEAVDPGNLLRIRRPGTGALVLVGTRRLPGGIGLPEGECAAFCLTQERWLVGGLVTFGLDGDQVLRSSQPVDLVLDWTKGTAMVTNRGARPVDAALGAALGGEERARALAPGSHTLKLRLARRREHGAAIKALPSRDTSRSMAPSVDENKGACFAELWSKEAQTPSASVVHPIRVRADHEPETMAVHNLHDGFMWSSSIPAPVWRVRELVLTIEPPEAAGPITGLRAVGSVGRIEIEEQRGGGEYAPLPAEEARETLFAGYSSNRVGGRLYTARRFSFTSTSRRFRVRLLAADPKAPTVHVGEIQLLGQPNLASVWGRLLLDRMTPESELVLFCRTGTSVDTLERGGSIRALSLEGAALWEHDDTAPSQYRGKYWCTGDVDADGSKDLVTYADDMVVRIFSAAGRVAQTLDLHAWEDERKGSPIGHTHYGGKSIALWPTRENRRPDLFIAGHVHHYQIRLGADPEVTRRDRVPTWDCAPAASAAVNGWSGPGKQNLVGVAPYATGIILLEHGGLGQPPRRVTQKPFTKPLVQPSANNQQPVFVECLQLRRPQGVVAVTPRGAQLFAKPDLTPGWVFAGTCPTSAAALAPHQEGESDRVFLGRENGRVLLIDAATGTLRAQALLDGAVRRMAVTTTGDVIVGTTTGLFRLDARLALIGRHACVVEDMALCETAQGVSVFALSPNGQLAAFQCSPRRRR